MLTTAGEAVLLCQPVTGALLVVREKPPLVLPLFWGAEDIERKVATCMNKRALAQRVAVNLLRLCDRNVFIVQSFLVPRTKFVVVIDRGFPATDQGTV
jgi:hypothetical protein